MATFRCLICDQPFKFGPGVYEGRVVIGWKREMICRHCENSNMEGIVPSPPVQERFRKKGIETQLNASGWIIIPQ